MPIVRDISQGLRFLHSANPPVVHGDLKSKNVLIDGQFRAKVSFEVLILVWYMAHVPSIDLFVFAKKMKQTSFSKLLPLSHPILRYPILVLFRNISPEMQSPGLHFGCLPNCYGKKGATHPLPTCTRLESHYMRYFHESAHMKGCDHPKSSNWSLTTRPT